MYIRWCWCSYRLPLRIPIEKLGLGFGTSLWTRTLYKSHEFLVTALIPIDLTGLDWACRFKMYKLKLLHDDQLDQAKVFLGPFKFKCLNVTH